MSRSLTTRIALSYVFLTLALNLMLLGVLRYALSGSLQKGLDTFLLEFNNEALEEPLSENILEELNDDYHENPLSKEFYIRIIDQNGVVRHADGMDDDANLQDVLALKDATAPGTQRKDTMLLPDGSKLRVFTRKVEDGHVFQTGALLIDDPALTRRVMRLGFLGVVFLTVIAASIGWLMARRAMKGVREVTLTARHIFEGALEARVPDQQNVIEVQDLAQAFNGMLDKLGALVADVKGVSADMAHDLRGPLTRLRSHAEVVLRGNNAESELVNLANKVVDETTILEGLIDTTLDIIALDAGGQILARTPAKLELLARDALEIYQDLADDKGLRIEITLNDAVMATVDAPMVRRILANLLENAVKFTPSGGTVSFKLHTQADQAVFTISDSGPGIPKSDRERIFERFYRGDASRGTPGYGLGLSYVQAAVHAHGGHISVTESDIGGARFQITLPQSRKS